MSGGRRRHACDRRRPRAGPGPAVGDPARRPVRLEQVIDTLVGGAVRRTPEGRQVDGAAACNGEEVCGVVNETGAGERRPGGRARFALVLSQPDGLARPVGPLAAA